MLAFLQKFTLIAKSLTTDSEIISIINLEPQFIIQEPNVDEYKLIIVAFNEKGVSDAVTITQEDIIDESEGNCLFLFLSLIATKLN